MAKSIKKNYIYNVSYQILLLLTPLITTPYVSRILGADGIGTYSYISSIVTYFVMIETLGTYHYGQREISYRQDDKHGRSVAFWNLVVFRTVNVIICTIVYIVFMMIQKTDRAIFAVMICSIVEVAFDITWFFQGMEEFGRIVLRNFILKCLSIAYIFLFVKKKDDLILYVAGIVVTNLLGNISLWAFVPKFIERVSLRELRPWKDIRAILALFVPTVAIDVYTVLDKVMIGIFTEESFENGYYEQAMRVAKMLLTLVTALGTVMIPRIGHHFAEGDIESVRKYMYRGYNFVWFLGIPLCFGLFGISDNMVPWFYGNGFDKVSFLLKISCFLIPIIGTSNVTGRQYLIPTKQQNLYTRSVIIGAAVNFVLNLFLIPRFFSIGALAASVMAELTIAIAQLFMVRKELSSKTIIKLMPHYLIAGAIMLAVVLYCSEKLSASVVHSAVIVAVGAAIYFIALLCQRDEFMLQNLKNILRRMPFKKTR